MKKTRIIEFFKNIKKTLVSFVSISVFVMLGVALFTSLSWSSTSFRESISEEIKTYKVHDIEIDSLYGFTNEEIESFSKISEDIVVIPNNYTYAISESNDIRHNIEIAGIPSNCDIDKFSYIEGNLPTNYDEIAITSTYSKENNIKIGDEISFVHDFKNTNHLNYAVLNKDISELVNNNNTSGMYYLNSDTFKVTAIVDSPFVISTHYSAYGYSDDGLQNETIMFVDSSAFDLKAFPNYKSIILYSDELNKLDYYSEEYKNKLDKLTNKCKGEMTSLAIKKYRQILEGITYLNTPNPEIDFPGYPELNKDQYNPNFTSYYTKLNNGSIAFAEISYKGTSNLRWSLCSMLIVIGLLVTYSVVTRIVFEQSVLIGTKKALGFSRKSITTSYLAYSLFATLLGSIFGVLLGRFIIEPVAYNQVMNNFIVHSYKLSMNIFEAIILFLIEIVLISLSTLFACNKTLKKDAVSLLQGEEVNKQKSHKFESTKLWKKSSLLSKTIVNNFFNDKKRVFATIIGIIGCTSLMSCGITFIDNVSNSSDYHYKEIQSYDTMINYSNSPYDISGSVTGNKFKMKLDEMNIESAEVFTSSAVTMFGDSSTICNLMVSGDENFDNLFSLTTLRGKKKSILDDGVWISQSIANSQKIKEGDVVDIMDAYGIHKITISHIARFYLVTPTIFMNMDTYNEQFNNGALFTNGLIIKRNNISIKDINRNIKDIEGYIYTYDTYGYSIKGMEAVSGAFTFMSFLYLFMSIAMAFLVILNLLITFVNEKKKDLITLMINGYDRKSTKKYIYSDTIFLTIVGVVIGVLLGYLFARISINAISCDSMLFLRRFNLLGALIGLLTTAVLVLIMSFISLNKINHFKLTDISKDQ